MTPRKLAKGCLLQARRAKISALAMPRGLPWLRRRLGLPSNEIFDPLVDVSGEHTRTVLLDAGETFQRPLPKMVGPDAAALGFFAQRSTDVTEPSYVSEFKGGIAWGHRTGGVLTSDGRFVPAFTHDPCGARFHSVWARVRLPAPTRIAGRVLYLVTPEATDNFHHWLIDLIPRLGLVQRAGYRLNEFDHVIVNFSRRGYQLSTLAHLGIASEKLIAADESHLFRTDTLVVPSLKPDNQTMPAADLAFLRGAFLESAPTDSRPRRRIFLSRADAGYRQLRNERELYPLLQALDFEIVSPGRLDVLAQAKLFSEAEIIAGPAGAAFANLVFAPKSTRVIEIVPPQWLAAFHWMISARAGLEHTIVLGEGELMKGVPDSSARHKDLVVDISRFSTALERVAEGVKA